MVKERKDIMGILSVGRMSGISNTCRLRTEALKSIADTVDVINSEEKPITLWYKIAYHLFLYGLPVHLPDIDNANNKIISCIRNKQYDIIWIDKGITINPSTLKTIKKIQPETVIVSYSPDNMAKRHNQSQNYLECMNLYDMHFTTKSYILEDMKSLGAKQVFFVNKSYEESFHYPRNITEEDVKRLGEDVGFVGAWEKERMDSVLFLSRNGVKVRVFGTKEWQQCKNDNPCLTIEDHGLYNEDYAKSFRCFKISLCFLRKMNLDQQTSRTMEIPACGGFMLAERTKEHMQLFKEGLEAEFFSDNDELLRKCRYYLEHEEERMKIAEAGTIRCKKSGYSNVDTLRSLVDKAMKLKMQRGK